MLSFDKLTLETCYLTLLLLLLLLRPDLIMSVSPRHKGRAFFPSLSLLHLPLLFLGKNMNFYGLCSLKDSGSPLRVSLTCPWAPSACVCRPGPTWRLTVLICIEWIRARIMSSPGLWSVVMVDGKSNRRGGSCGQGSGLCALEVMHVPASPQQACEVIVISISQTSRLRPWEAELSKGTEPSTAG